MQHLGGLGETAMVDHGLQGSPLIERHAGSFHSIVFLSPLSGTLAACWRSLPVMKRFCTLLAMFPLTALAVSYPVEVEQQLNGTEVLVSTEIIDRDMAGVLLQNYGATPVACSAVFRNGPEAPRTRRTTLQAGERKPLTAKFKRDVIRLRIKLTCEAQ